MFPKRGAVAIGLTGLALALLLSFKTPSDPAALAGSAGGLAVADQPAATPGATNGGAAGAPSATAAPETTTAPTATAAPTAAATETPATAGASGTYTGDAVAIRWGVVQVQVTIENGQLVDVTAVQLPTNDQHSAMISQQVEPILRSSAISAQSAEIDLVSGATYTSMAYAQSLQAALDQAGL